MSAVEETVFTLFVPYLVYLLNKKKVIFSTLSYQLILIFQMIQVIKKT